MTFQIGSIRITVFKFEKLEKPILSIDKDKAKQDAQDIINTPEFQALRKKAQLKRQAQV